MRGVTVPKNGQIQVDPGVILLGYRGDSLAIKRPPWAKGGSMMVFRKLEQSVPEFNKWLRENGPRWREFRPTP
ncbi:hypothetical protein D9758_018706 [Tetrapyrgos nigripes]|uniref:Uncharacterized protein n=1 Tax=Tetrapyrgos nigripes TaxID=182062 RepID=A0A8H5B9B5_9AGAR|nr:hypothetical protein D9758_018706 [Tetrapyrgos nigripes]